MGRISLYLVTAKLVLLSGLLVASETAERAPTVERGQASFYADALEGNKTASGEPYQNCALTAAHRSLPFGTKVVVTYLKTGKSVEVVINDRGPYAEGRIIDVSRAAAEKLGLIDDGHGDVRLEITSKP